MDASDVIVAGVRGDYYPPPGVIFYETGPLTTRVVEVKGRLWAMTYHAEQDNVGWRVNRISIAPYEDEPNSLNPGDLVDIRCKILEDHGADVQVRVESPHYCQSFWVKRSAITRIHRPAA